jgi:hypothetical protein
MGAAMVVQGKMLALLSEIPSVDDASANRGDDRRRGCRSDAQSFTDAITNNSCRGTL